MHGVSKAPGLGSFTFEDDKAKVGQVLLSLIWTKLDLLAKDKDFSAQKLPKPHHVAVSATSFHGGCCVGSFQERCKMQICLEHVHVQACTASDT